QATKDSTPLPAPAGTTTPTAKGISQTPSARQCGASSPDSARAPRPTRRMRRAWPARDDLRKPARTTSTIRPAIDGLSDFGPPVRIADCGLRIADCGLKRFCDYVLRIL